jgi:Tfp pilus assembly PilM family ATPase
LAKAVGLDIGSRACKVAVLSGGAKGARLVRYAEKEYEYGEAGALTPAAVLAALRAALSEARASKDVVCVALPAEQCTLREITVPFTDDDQIKKVVKFEFEPHLHSASIEDVVIDYVKTGETRSGTRLLVFAVGKETLRTRLEQLREVKVDPLHVDVDVASLFNTAKQSGVFDEHPNCLIIDIGARTTKTLLVQNGRLKVARSIRLGAQSTLQRLTAEFEGDADAARRAMDEAASLEALAQPPGTASTLEIVASVQAIEAMAAGAQESDFLGRVLRETQRTLPTMTEEQRLTCVYVTGLGAGRPHARARLAEHYGVPVEDLPTLRAVAHSLPPSEADKVAKTGAVAVGAALKVLGIDAGEIDLRREEFRFARKFDAVKLPLATLVTLIFFGLFLVTITKMQQLRKLRAQRADLQKLMETELRADVLDEYESVPTARHQSEAERKKDADEDLYFARTRTRLNEVRNHLKNELGLSTGLPPIRSGVETWNVVMQVAKEVRDKIPYIAVRSERYDQEKIVLSIVFGDYPDIDTFVNALRRRADIVASVDPMAPRPLKDKGIEIEIKVTLKPLEAEPEEAAGEAPAPGAGEPAKGEDAEAPK